jgi:hemerythrin
MPIIECDSKFYSENIWQHNKRLTALVNCIYDQFAEYGTIQDIDSVITALTEHAARNFSQEESLLPETLYPGLAGHKMEHQMFKEAVFKLKHSRQSKAALTVDILWFLVNWATHHVRETDFELSQCHERHVVSS